MIMLLYLICCFSYFYFINSSHFYGGSISSKPIKDNGDNVTFNFTIRFSYRSSYSSETYCDSNTILNKTLIGPHYNIYCVSGCNHPYTAIGNSQIYCLSYSKEIDWTYGSRTFSYTIPKVNKYQLAFYGSDWRSLVVFGYNRTGASWELRHTLDSTNHTFTKIINSSPETVMSPVTTLPINSYYALDIPYIDEDNDIVRCRWAEWLKMECQDVCEAVPFGYLDNNECKLYLNTSQAHLGFYAAAIQIEDFKQNNFSHPISSVPLQFIIHIVEESNCTTSPNLSHIYPEKSCIAINDKLNISFYARTECENVNITEISIIGAPGSILHDMIYDTIENKWTRSLSLNSSDHGHHLICARAIDSDFKSSEFSCLRVFNGATQPYIIQSSLSPTGKLNTTLGILNFSAEFNVDVRSPNSSRLIRIISSQTQDLIYLISSNNVTFFDNSSKISFPVDLSLLSEGNFCVLFDYGVAVSTDFCNSISEKIDDVFFWEFSLEKPNFLFTTEKESDTTEMIVVITNTVHQTEALSIDLNRNCSIENFKERNECNIQSISIIFTLINIMLIGFHHIILYTAVRYLRIKKY